MNIKVAENLKAFRRMKGNTQEELAIYLGVSIQAVSKWERGRGLARHYPAALHCAILCQNS